MLSHRLLVIGLQGLGLALGPWPGRHGHRTALYGAVGMALGAQADCLLSGKEESVCTFTSDRGAFLVSSVCP